jgi:transposase
MNPPGKLPMLSRKLDATLPSRYKWRHRVENLFQRIKENRRLAMRYEKLDSTFAGFLALALLKLEVC